jgi:predicted dehydrogenase
MSSNERIAVSVMGVNSRGKALASNFARQKDCDVLHICDVDSRAILACQERLAASQDIKTRGFRDFRESLQDREIDALVIAAPDHWHAPAALLAMQGMQELKEGAIGLVYFGKGWYANNRKSIGYGKESEVPEWLNWELWQGPAPRRAFKDNLVHYNWQWFWHWGTGEALNNGTHMIDMLRWGMEVDYPVKVSSNGGRYRYQDDWETPDTQVINIDFKEGLTMTWEGRSCNGKSIEGSGAGVIFYGENGSMLFPGGNIAQRVGHSLEINPENGHILHDEEACKYWSRSYEDGWEMKL